MKVKELVEKLDLEVISEGNPDRDINGVYIGDLLSWVMSNADSDNVWITIMSNINIVAVATLVDTSAIIVCEGVELDDTVIETAKSKGINIMSTTLTAYETALKIAEIIN